MSEQKHAPTPWSIGEYGEIRGADGDYVIKNYYEGYEISAADSSLIARAVNSHEQLVAALKTSEACLMQMCYDQHPDNQCWADLAEVRAALAAAGAK